jgi:hypothetical protein
VGLSENASLDAGLLREEGMEDGGVQVTADVISRRQNACTRSLLEAIALLMAPADANLKDFDHYLEVNELGLALDALNWVVNYGRCGTDDPSANGRRPARRHPVLGARGD